MASKATITGGSVALAARDSAFNALTAVLDNDADAVESIVRDNMELLLGTGYLPASINRTSSPLNDTGIVSLNNNGTTQVLLRLAPVVNAKAYQVETSERGQAIVWFVFLACSFWHLVFLDTPSGFPFVCIQVRSLAFPLFELPKPTRLAILGSDRILCQSVF
jgi:hypothetical protein